MLEINNNRIIHLKLHTEYSLLEGVGKIDEYISRAKELGINALTITDTSMFGVVEFYKKCKKENIKPIIGLEVYLDGIETEGEYSLTLIAKNQNGYRNLSKLSSLSYSRFNRRRNKIKYEELMNYSSDLYIFTGGINSETIKGLVNHKYPEVKKIIKKLKEDFKDNLFVEVPSINRLENVRNNLIELINETETNYIITNDIYYVNSGDSILQKIMLSIKEGSKIEANSSDILYSDLYLKSYEEVAKLFSDKQFLDVGIKNNNEIVKNCNVDFEFDKFKFPKYNLPQGIEEEQYLRSLVYEGLEKKYLKNDFSPNFVSEKNIWDIEKTKKQLLKNNFDNVINRIEYELEIINKMGYNGYFIIVWDFIKYAKENGIYVGPGRGSAAGSLVSYGLNITEIDPIKYNLIFERFLNPERISMPDIDIDFDQEQREQVINYVFEKYGKEYTAHIITFGTLKARAAIRDVGRVLNVSLSKVDKIAKLIPFNMDLTEALSSIDGIKKMYNSDDEIKKIIDFSLKLEGKVRHASIHAAGVVISKEELDEEIPLYSDGKTSMVSTQYQMKELEDLGILKIDFLGLKNLTVLRKTIENIKKTKNKEINLQNIPLDDKKTYDLLTKADTMGVFQCESSGIRRLMKKMKIEKFEDITALLALYRPGPLLSGMVDDFIASKNTSADIKYIDNSLKDILKETYGVILYQEQVMRIVSEMAGYTLGEADELRRAIGKKIPEIIEKNREKFVKRATKKGVDIKKANNIYNLIDKFGGYGFNKSHSAAYALIVYWTAYFKSNYTTEFFAAIMSNEMNNIDRLSIFINEAREKGIEVLVPSINSSSYEFVVENEKAIRFGMTAIKGIGENFVSEIIKERQNKIFDKYDDFVYRMKQKGLNKKNLESLILSGCLDDIKDNRKEKYEAIDEILKWSQKKYDFEEDLQLILFGGKATKVGDFYVNKQEEYPLKTMLKYEKEYLGIYVSSHPLNAKKNLLEMLEYTKISELSSFRNRNKLKKYDKIRVVGILKNVNKMITKSGEPMAKFEIEDFTGIIEGICFPRDFVDYGYKIIEDEIVILEGILKEDGNRYSLISNSISDTDSIFENKNLKLYILIDDESINKQEDLKKLIKKYKGDSSVYFAIKTGGKQEIKKMPPKYNINLSKYFIKDLVNLIGYKRIKIG